MVHQFSFSVYGALLLDIIFLNLKAASFGGGSVPPRGGLEAYKEHPGSVEITWFPQKSMEAERFYVSLNPDGNKPHPCINQGFALGMSLKLTL